jgi:hypothetical protein
MVTIKVVVGKETFLTRNVDTKTHLFPQSFQLSDVIMQVTSTNIELLPQ